MTRKLGVAVTPTVELTQEADGKLTLSSKSSFKNVSITFNLGEEFDEITPDGRKVRSLVTVDGNKLIQTQKNGKETTTIREFTPEKMVIVSIVR
jgi:fatty acid-binding protein 7